MAVVVKGLLMDGAAFIASERVFFLQSGSLVSLDVGVLYDTVAPRKEPVVHMRAEDLSYQLFAAEPCPRDASVIACLGFNKEESDFVLILKIDLQGSAAFRVVAQHSIKGCASNVLWSPSGSYLCAVQDTDDGNCNCEAVTLFRLTLEQKQPTKSQSGTKDDQSAPQQTTKYRLTCIAEGKKSFPVFLSLNESHIDCLAMYKYQREASTIEIWDRPLEPENPGMRHSRGHSRKGMRSTGRLVFRNTSQATEPDQKAFIPIMSGSYRAAAAAMTCAGAPRASSAVTFRLSAPSSSI